MITISLSTATVNLIKAMKEYESIFGHKCFFRQFKDRESCYIAFPYHKEYYQGISIFDALERAEELVYKG